MQLVFCKTCDVLLKKMRHLWKDKAGTAWFTDGRSWILLHTMFFVLPVCTYVFCQIYCIFFCLSLQNVMVFITRDSLSATQCITVVACLRFDFIAKGVPVVTVRWLYVPHVKLQDLWSTNTRHCYLNRYNALQLKFTCILYCMDLPIWSKHKRTGWETTVQSN